MALTMDVKIFTNLTEEQQAIIFRIKEVMKSRRREALPSLKTCDKRIVQTETSKVNSVVQYITTSNITDCNNLLYYAALVVSELSFGTSYCLNQCSTIEILSG